MNRPSTATNVITGIFATFFSILFVVSFFVTAIVWSITSTVTPDGLTNFFTSDNVIDFITEDEAFNEMIENSGIPNDAIADLLESKFADEVLTSLADGMSAELLGTKPNATYDEEYFKDLCLKNKDYIMEFLERYPEAEGASDEEMDEAFDNFVTEIPAQLAGTITELSAELDGTDDAVDYAQMYQIAVKQLPIILTVNSFILLVICWLLRIKFTYGLLWPGVTSVVGGTITALLSMLIGSSTDPLAEFAEATYIIPILNILSEKLLIGSTVPLAIGIALIVAKAIITKKALNSEETNESCIRN